MNYLEILEYPYGKTTKTLRNAIKWLNNNKSRLVKIYDIGEFDSPNYWGMPKKISYKLDVDEIDWLQSEVNNWSE